MVLSRGGGRAIEWIELSNLLFLWLVFQEHKLEVM